MNKTQFDKRMSFLADVRQKLMSLSFEQNELDFLDELIEDQKVRETQEWRWERAEAAVHLLFPRHTSNRDNAPPALRWHEKSWWWNGGHLKHMRVLSNGDLSVDMQSYVGCGETDSFEGLILKKGWVEANDMAAAIQLFLQTEVERQQREELHNEMNEAQANLQAAQARLALLKGAQS